MDCPGASEGGITAATLGSSAFREAHRVRHAYVSGSMYRGIASADLVIRMGKAGLLGYFGTGGMELHRIEEAILKVQRELGPDRSFGMNLLCNLDHPETELAIVDLFFRHGILRLEAAAYTQITQSLVWFRVRGLREQAGRVRIAHSIMAKVSRPEVALEFLSPPPQKLVERLCRRGMVSRAEAELAPRVPMCDDLCVEADSGGHTDKGVAFALIPTMLRLRDEAIQARFRGASIRVGAAGGIGTPHAVAAAFVLGADFVLTGSVNQCTVEAGTSELVKDMLAGMNVQDTSMAPAGDMFEIGAKVQVLSKGVFFPARANRLYELYRQYNSLDEIDAKTRQQIEGRYFKRTFEEVYQETKDYYLKAAPEQVERAETSPRFKMALVFRWYFVKTSRLALDGVADERSDFQVHCGPALGAFNQWVKGTRYEDWRNRHPDQIADLLMRGAAALLQARVSQWRGSETNWNGNTLWDSGLLNEEKDVAVPGSLDGPARSQRRPEARPGWPAGRAENSP
jgi:trans-AT polyketide synthase, acyltransferase and oxidoreductase domains